MKRDEFTEQQIAFALKRAELGTSVEEVCSKLSISDAPQLAWLLPLDNAGYAGPCQASGLHRTERARIAYNLLWHVSWCITPALTAIGAW